ncbi:hypothetical protein TNCV_776881 [Trichonephila clavipes]|nr:hypothetical protein TNCV_776881 [Trichonephila clavipes]
MSSHASQPTACMEKSTIIRHKRFRALAPFTWVKIAGSNPLCTRLHGEPPGIYFAPKSQPICLGFFYCYGVGECNRLREPVEGTTTDASADCQKGSVDRGSSTRDETGRGKERCSIDDVTSGGGLLT